MGIHKRPRLFIYEGESFCCSNIDCGYQCDLSEECGDKGGSGAAAGGGEEGGGREEGATMDEDNGPEEIKDNGNENPSQEDSSTSDVAVAVTNTPSVPSTNVQETVGVCWPTAAPVPAGVKKEDSCAMESHCQPIVRDCDCYQSCEVRVEGSLIFAHDCPGGQECDTNHQQEIDCNTNILILKKLSQLLNKYDGSGNTNRLVVELHGHTDASGGDAYNLPLSSRRIAYVRWLLSTKIENVDLTQIVAAKGYGERCLKVGTCLVLLLLLVVVVVVCLQLMSHSLFLFIYLCVLCVYVCVSFPHLSFSLSSFSLIFSYKR